MRNILIGVGGTGSKILTSAAFLQFFGFYQAVEKSEKNENRSLDSVDNLCFRMVDNDTTNGNIDKLTEILACLGVFRKANHDKSWTPLCDLLPIPPITADLPGTDDNGFCFATSARADQEYKVYMETLDQARDNYREMLFDPDDLSIKVSDGFKGRPYLGVIPYHQGFQADIKKRSGSFWNSVLQDSDCKVLFAGSIFGGTGAAGVQNLAQLFSKDVASKKNCMTGMLFALPYYRFEADSGQEDEIAASSKEFEINTSHAIRYYNQDSAENPDIPLVFQGVLSPQQVQGNSPQNEEAHTACVYFVGGKKEPSGGYPTLKYAKPRVLNDKQYTAMRYAPTGKDQVCPASRTDLEAALFTAHFFLTQQSHPDHNQAIYFPPDGDKTILCQATIQSILLRLQLFCQFWLYVCGLHEKGLKWAKKPPFSALDISKHLGGAEKAHWNKLGYLHLFVDKATEWLAELAQNGINNFMPENAQIKTDLTGAYNESHPINPAIDERDTKRYNYVHLTNYVVEQSGEKLRELIKGAKGNKDEKKNAIAKGIYPILVKTIWEFCNIVPFIPDQKEGASS